MPEFFIPDNIDLKVLVKDIKRPDVRRNVIFGCAYVFDHFCQYPKTGKGKDIFEKTGGGVPVTMTTLREEIGSKTADRVMSLLLDKGLLKIIGRYVPDLNISRVYVLQIPSPIWDKIILDHKKKPSIVKKTKNPHNARDPDGLDFLKIWLDNKFLVLDHKSVDFFIQFFYNRLYHVVKQMKTSYVGEKKKEYVSKLLSVLSRRYLEVHQSVSDFEESIQNSSRSETNGRFNTYITSMPKPVRHFLSCQGNSLTEIDINASQPLFLFILLSQVKNFKKEQLNSSTQHIINTHPFHTPNPSKQHHMLSTFSLTELKQFEEEMYRFGTLFENGGGDFYENLSNELNSVSEPLLNEFSTRTSTKLAFMHLLFERFTGKKKAIPSYQVFRKAFPMILRLMDVYKSDEKNRLALLLQRMESEMILDRIARRFALENPEAPIYTIHDALLTTEAYSIELNKLIISELQFIAKIRPTTKIKNLTPDSLFNDLKSTIKNEIQLIKKKSRTVKKLNSPDYQFFRLFVKEVPRWKSEKVMTISVWGQVKDNPNYKPIRISVISQLISGLQATSKIPLKPIFDEPLNETFTTKHVVEKGYVVPPMFQFVEDDEEEREKE